MDAELVSEVKPALVALLGAVAFVLLIACANVANLILVRTSRRERELAVRAAFGGSRSRLVRQMLAEALVLAMGGAVLGLAVAKAGIGMLVAIGPQDIPESRVCRDRWRRAAVHDVRRAGGRGIVRRDAGAARVAPRSHFYAAPERTQ